MQEMEAKIEEQYGTLINVIMGIYNVDDPQKDLSLDFIRVQLDAIAPIKSHAEVLETKKIAGSQNEMRKEKTFEGGSTYEGEWQKGTFVKQGYGSLVDPDGSRYDGCFHEDYPHGMGRMIYANLDIFYGQWEDGREHGFGLQFQANEKTYQVGQWKDGKLQGYGREGNPKCQVYNGSFVGGLKHGKGTRRNNVNNEEYNVKYNFGEQV